MHHSSSAVIRRFVALAMVLAASAAAAVPATGPNIVVNGGFETRDLTGWSQAGDIGFTGVQCGVDVYEGNCNYFAGTVGATSTLSQTLQTSSGLRYLIRFAFMPDGASPSTVAVRFGSQVLLSLTDPAASDFLAQEFVAIATGTTMDLSFVFRNDPGFFVLDAVNVAAIPEPAPNAILAVGLMALLFTRRSRKA